MKAEKFDIVWRRGDTTNRIYFSIVVNDVPMVFTGKIIEMHVKVGNFKGKLVKEFSSSNGIVIDNDQFYIEKFTVDIPVGRYAYDIEINDNGEIKTYVEGSLTVTPDITNAPR